MLTGKPNLLFLFRKHCSGILGHKNVESCFLSNMEIFIPWFSEIAEMVMAKFVFKAFL